MDRESSPILVKRPRVFRKICCVSRCTSSSKDENIIFFPIPKTEARVDILDVIERRTWKRPNVTSLQSGIYICQNHYDLQEDVKFFQLYDPKNNDKKHPLRLKPNILPHIFDINIEEAPIHPDYVLASERFSTYIELQNNGEIPYKVMELLIEAGFFYDGRSKFSCFCCGGEIQDWQELCPIPWKEHVQKFPTCKFLLLIKGEEYVASSKKNANDDQLQIPEDVLEVTNDIDPDLENNTFNLQPTIFDEVADTELEPTPSTSKGNDTGSVKLSQGGEMASMKDRASSCDCKQSRHSRHLVECDSPGNQNKSSPTVSTPSKSTSDADFTPSGTGGSQDSSDTYHSEFERLDRQLTNEQIGHLMVSISAKNSKVFLGIDKDKFEIIKLLAQYVKRSNAERDVIIVLRRIRLFETFEVLGIHFGLSSSQIYRIYNDVLPIISKCFKQYIFKSNKNNVYFNLPVSFRSNYFMVTEILDCFETRIQKPSNPIHQAFSWSDYKQGNTVKYLLSVHPCGHICFVSEGYGGRVSDMQVTRSCGYLETLEKGTVALADRGFKHLEAEFADRECTLLRPPSVSAEDKLSEEESLVTKHIAALRIHVERVIGRLREFEILSPHACIDPSMLGLQDEAVIVACGLVNLQRKITRY